MRNSSVEKLVEGLMPCEDRYPRPQWDCIAERVQGLLPVDENAVWWDVAQCWVMKTCAAAAPHYRLERSENFLLGSPLQPEAAQNFLQFAERSRRRVLAMLKGLAASDGFGPHVVFVFESEDAYYEYVAPFYPEGGHFAASSGVHLDPGYGHFAIPLGETQVMEAVVAHELTHSMLAHLPLPRWVNEGIAVNIESTLCPQSRRGLSADWIERHRRHWNYLSVQEYWSGKAFSRPGELSKLSYELAWVMIKHLAEDYETFRKFVAEATYQDAGQAAAIKHLGVGLGGFIAPLLGDGDWEPTPVQWSTHHR